VGLYGVKRQDTRINGVIRDYIGIYEKTGLHGSYVTPYKNIQDYMGLYGIIWGYTRLYGVIRD
jgi:hypothetical protein